MGRKYEVYIDGRRLVIAGPNDPPDDMDIADRINVSTAEGIAEAVRNWRSSPSGGALLLRAEDVDAAWDLFADRYELVAAAGGCVTDERRRLLAIHRLGKWDLPKGKLDDGETAEAGAIREVREECGVKRLTLVKRLCATWHTYERKGRPYLKRTDWYLMRGSSADPLVPQLSEDISEVRWMDGAEVQRMKVETYPSLLGVITAWERAVRDPA